MHACYILAKAWHYAVARHPTRTRGWAFGRDGTPCMAQHKPWHARSCIKLRLAHCTAQGIITRHVLLFSRPPALAMLEWAPPGVAPGSDAAASLPLLALVGKGVCFDTGGLDLKPAASMKMMKKVGEAEAGRLGEVAGV